MSGQNCGILLLCPLLMRCLSVQTRVPNSQKKKPDWTCVRGVAIFLMEEGPPTPPGRFRGRSPVGTCRNIYAATVARFGRAILGLVHPLCSIRRFRRCGVGRPIALHTCQMLKPTVPYPCMSAVRSRRPAVSAFASESHLRSHGGISGSAGHPARPALASSRGSRVSMHRFARSQPSPSICSGNPELPVAARRESPF